MEWTRIEAKWHDMARRLQHGHTSFPDQIGPAPSSASSTARVMVQDAALRAVDDGTHRTAEA